VARYEEIRRYAVAQQRLTARFGLAVLLHQGLAAWVEQWSKMPAPTPLPAAESARPSAMPEETHAEVINVLAAMALGHLQEVHA
jgi:hypothetical protein